MRGVLLVTRQQWQLQRCFGVSHLPRPSNLAQRPKLGPCSTKPSRNSKPAKPRRRSEERRVGKECRSRCDWSSDVCSSDLWGVAFASAQQFGTAAEARAMLDKAVAELKAGEAAAQIGRASCRERV